ncbi:MAG: Hsp33 family molecular chaperone HslO [Clostridia bacterium]|nr:Hsp33 family molecular chaperone HslO [Clostridia bacterium]
MENSEKGYKDKLVRGLLFWGTVNMTAISARDLVEEARKAHSLSHVTTAALGRILMQTAMMSAQLKNSSDNLTVIFDGDGKAGRFVAVGKEGGRVKGYADFPEVELPLKENGKLDVSGAVGTDGELRVIRDLSLKEPYVGRCAITDGEIANDFANYFMKSEQQPSLVYLGVRVDPKTGEVRAASGLLLQPMPFCLESDIELLEKRTGEITRLTRMIEEGNSLEDALGIILDGFDPEFSEEITPAFSCDCSRKKIESALVSLGRDELKDIIEKDGRAELVCRFCQKKYEFGLDELKELLAFAENAGEENDIEE